MTYYGSLFHSSIILLEKNDFRAVVLHLGLNSFCECPRNPCVSKAGWKYLALSTLSFSLSILYTSIMSPRSLRFSSEHIPNCFNLSSYGNFLNPLTRGFVALLWICSRQSLSSIGTRNVINSNLGPVSYRFGDELAYGSKNRQNREFEPNPVSLFRDAFCWAQNAPNPALHKNFIKIR